MAKFVLWSSHKTILFLRLLASNTPIVLLDVLAKKHLQGWSKQKKNAFCLQSNFIMVADWGYWWQNLLLISKADSQ